MNKFHDICNLCDDKYLKKVMCEDYVWNAIYLTILQLYTNSYMVNKVNKSDKKSMKKET